MLVCPPKSHTSRARCICHSGSSDVFHDVFLSTENWVFPDLELDVLVLHLCRVLLFFSNMADMGTPESYCWWFFHRQKPLKVGEGNIPWFTDGFLAPSQVVSISLFFAAGAQEVNIKTEWLVMRLGRGCATKNVVHSWKTTRPRIGETETSLP